MCRLGLGAEATMDMAKGQCKSPPGPVDLRYLYGQPSLKGGSVVLPPDRKKMPNTSCPRKCSNLPSSVPVRSRGLPSVSHPRHAGEGQLYGNPDSEEEVSRGFIGSGKTKTKNTKNANKKKKIRPQHVFAQQQQSYCQQSQRQQKHYLKQDQQKLCQKQQKEEQTQDEELHCMKDRPAPVKDILQGNDQKEANPFCCKRDQDHSNVESKVDLAASQNVLPSFLQLSTSSSVCSPLGVCRMRRKRSRRYCYTLEDRQVVILNSCKPSRVVSRRRSKSALRGTILLRARREFLPYFIAKRIHVS